ncbi:MAG: ArsA family ATPase [Anaerolineae bacterium]
MRILLYTGKGGVGKTSVSASTALRCADLGYRTIVVSTDPAHSLADSFDMPLGAEPTPITDNLWGQEIDLLHQMEKYWGMVQEYLSALLAWRGLDQLLAEETAVLPGMEELASLLQIVYLHDTGEYDVIIIDSAPTGATLQLLAFPEMARWYLDRIFPIQTKAIQLSRPILRAVTDMPIPEDHLFRAIEQLIRELERMHQLLTDPALSTARIVLNPEKMVIKEAQRALTYLNLYGYSVDLVVVNRMLPADAAGPYFDTWRQTQARYLQMIEEMFSPLPMRLVPMFEDEVVGLPMLRRMAERIYGNDDPTQIYYHGRTQTVERDGHRYYLRLPLALAPKEAIQLTHAGEELVIHIGNFKRTLLLPRVLAGRQVLGAQYADNVLTVTFAGDSNHSSPQE